MKKRLLVFTIALWCPILFQYCNEPSVDALPIVQQPPVITFAKVHLAVGNTYHWRYVRIPMPNIGELPSQWYVTSEITRDTTIDGDRYFVFNTGEILRSTDNIVYTPPSEYYRLNVSVGQSVPFMGHQFAVSAVDTSTFFGENQKIITVSAAPGDANTLNSARYATKFGLVEMDLSDATSATWVALVGARIGTVNYGYNP